MTKHSITEEINSINTKNQSIASLIREKRKKLNMTQKELADAIGMPKYGDRTIRRWENEETVPSNLELKSILNFPDFPPFKNPTNYKFKLVDLFAGIGGTRLGFQLNGRVNCIFSSEWDKFSAKTYRANFGDTPHGDITKIDAKDIPDHDILVAGFPCQAFSLAGLKKGFDDTRGTLFFDIARVLNEKRPKAFLLENVKNLRSHDKGKTFSIIINTLNELNYEVHTAVLKSTDFGCPQNRERIYIVGFDKNIIKNSADFRFPTPCKWDKTLSNILQKNVDEKYTISDKLWLGHQRRKKEHAKKGNGFGYSLFNEKSKYTNTLSARYYKDGSEILIEQPNQNPRKITPREAARLQGFPENFIIPVSDTQAYKQFGNSVSVPVIKSIAKNILYILDNNF
ncbi:DNA (cytosine-5-)-methyltransferase [Staphylococcus epidermidis]|uniref:DNA (cytosine-5-)-methyltransferase n=1 Tax=Staphylococcus epidermidis TaxID=1282 RepID=UPI001E46DC9F|nr:DNA (cytosine-5-)-methyltransferase [Staphylococcus epidermidis]MCD8886612.1 DNA (cytosine-5-)-methyltransferase [Staphylococcus epidermidis]MCG2496112.1 DNA (cytosine-5-)-methyltransferase [Staphylococcus epidermidis]MCG2518732.1 DNA (cytosine-5-)-methyltransferase [Staphylococcus epidermidis]